MQLRVGFAGEKLPITIIRTKANIDVMNQLVYLLSLFDGFPVTATSNGTTQNIFPGNPLADRYFSRLRIGVLFPIDIYAAFKGNVNR